VSGGEHWTPGDRRVAAPSVRVVSGEVGYRCDDMAPAWGRRLVASLFESNVGRSGFFPIPAMQNVVRSPYLRPCAAREAPMHPGTSPLH